MLQFNKNVKFIKSWGGELEYCTTLFHNFWAVIRLLVHRVYMHQSTAWDASAGSNGGRSAFLFITLYKVTESSTACTSSHTPAENQIWGLIWSALLAYELAIFWTHFTGLTMQLYLAQFHVIWVTQLHKCAQTTELLSCVKEGQTSLFHSQCKFPKI